MSTFYILPQTAPLFYKGKSLINIHDLCFVVNPHWYSFTFHTVYNFLVPRLARRATRIITNSNNSKNDLLQYCSVPADKVSLIYWAVDEIFIQDKSPGRAALSEDDFILYVGSLEPRKIFVLLWKPTRVLEKKIPPSKQSLF